MAHEFESGVFAGNRPAWHGLGTVLPSESLDSKEALQYSGLAGWGLSKQLVHVGGADDGFVEVPRYHAIVRATDRRVLGVVGEGYRIVQNEEAFDWMDTLLGGEGFHYHTAGSLRGGQIVWMLARAPFSVELPDSPIDLYVLLTNSHDGSSAVSAAVTPTRVVCMNTLRAALRGARATYTIRHTSSCEQKLADAQRVLGLTRGAAERVAATAAQLNSTSLSAGDWTAFLDGLVALPDEPGRGRTSAGKVREAITEIYETAPDQVEIRGTAWGAYNAVVAYHDHIMRSREGVGSAAENRMMRVMLKDSERQLPRRALALLTP